jgi:hypothetical protein
MAKNLVAEVAETANVGAAERAAVLKKLPEYVSSAAGGLGLLSLRPSENRNEKRRKSARTERGSRKAARNDRAIGSGPKGDLLRAIYVRIAMWMAKSALPVIVAASDEEIITFLPHLIGPAAARFVTGDLAAQKRTISQIIFDWRSVIGVCATQTAEDTNVSTTFYLEGADAERRFSLAVDVGSVRVVERPIPGTVPPMSLSAIVEETKDFRAPYMEWAELIRVAALNGDPVARRAEMLIKAGVVAGNTIASIVGAAVLVALVFFALPIPEAHAKAIEKVKHWINEWTVTNETPDGRLPECLRLHTPPALSNDNTEVRFLSETEAVLTLRRPEETLRRAEQSDPAFVGAHIEWEWHVTVGTRPPICKHTENAQLHVIFDPSMVGESVSSTVAPLIVKHSVIGPFTVGVPGPAGPLVPPEPGYFDQSDILVVADPRTYNTCVRP